MRNRLIGLALAMGASCAAARASPYWIAYEGDEFPENAGWTRHNFGDGPAVRSIADGIFTIDSLWSPNISDFYEIDRQMNPDPGELFVAEWRLRVVEEYGSPLSGGDAIVAVAGDEGNDLGLEYRVDEIHSTYDSWIIPIEPLIFHDYRLTTADMVNYSFYIDGTLALAGTFEPATLNVSFFAFGDGVNGRRSLTEWDYVRFGVVPEASSGLGLLGLGLLAARWRSYSTKGVTAHA